MAPRLEKLLPQGPRTQDKLPPGAQLLWLLALDHAGSLVEFFDRFGPEAHLQLVGKVGFEGMQIAQQVHPPALMPSWCVMVAAIKVADEYALEVLAQQVLSHLARSAVVILEVAQPVAGTQAPDIAVASILPPARLIGMDSLAGLHLGVQALHRCGADLAHARHVRFGKGQRRRLLVFQLGNPLLGSGNAARSSAFSACKRWRSARRWVSSSSRLMTPVYQQRSSLNNYGEK
jgi:hypothetical protein